MSIFDTIRKNGGSLEDRLNKGDCPRIPELEEYQSGTLSSIEGYSQNDVELIRKHIRGGCHSCNSVLDQFIDGTVRASDRY